MRHLHLGIRLIVIWAALGATPAAAAPDTFVSGTGVDSGDCAATTPCRSFQYALQRTKDGGTIAVQSSGSFAGVRINKSVTIIAEGAVAILRAAANCGAVICVDAQDSIVTLRGLTIDPMRTGINGIVVSAVRTLHVRHSTIRQSNVGLLVRCNGGGFGGKVDATDSIITENTQGITVVAKGTDKLAIDRVRIHDNVNGILFDNAANGGMIVASVSDSVIAGHSGYGIRAVGPAQGDWTHPTVSVTLDRTAVLNNGLGIASVGQATRVRIGDSTITGNGVALRSVSSGAIPSYGTNKLDGNGSGETPTVTIPSQ